MSEPRPRPPEDDRTGPEPVPSRREWRARIGPLRVEIGAGVRELAPDPPAPPERPDAER